MFQEVYLPKGDTCKYRLTYRFGASDLLIASKIFSHFFFTADKGFLKTSCYIKVLFNLLTLKKIPEAACPNYATTSVEKNICILIVKIPYSSKCLISKVFNINILPNC